MTPSRLRRHLDRAKAALSENLPPDMAVILILAPGNEDQPNVIYHTNMTVEGALILAEGFTKEMKGKTT